MQVNKKDRVQVLTQSYIGINGNEIGYNNSLKVNENKDSNKTEHKRRDK